MTLKANQMSPKALFMMKQYHNNVEDVMFIYIDNNNDGGKNDNIEYN
jgi:hypothetical protein